MDSRGHGGYSVVKETDPDGDVAPLLPNYQPSPYPAPPPPQMAAMSQQAANSTTVVEMQPLSGQPQVVHVPPRQANDHLWLTMALMFLCLLCCCNIPGALCLMPGLICATLGADFNKAGEIDKAKNMGSMAFIYDMVIVGINVAYHVILTIIVTIIVIVSMVKAL